MWKYYESLNYDLLNKQFKLKKQINDLNDPNSF